MALKQLKRKNITPPSFRISKQPKKQIFDLSSHKRAAEALFLGLSLNKPNFHVFVLGNSRQGRLTASCAFIRDYFETAENSVLLDWAEKRKDWLYLPNFETSYAPLAFCVPAGEGKRLQKAIRTFLENTLRDLQITFSKKSFKDQLRDIREKASEKADNAFSEAEMLAEKFDLIITQNETGFAILPDSSVEAPSQTPSEKDLKQIRNALEEAIHLSEQANEEQEQKSHGFLQSLAKRTVSTNWLSLLKTLPIEVEIQNWAKDLKADILENLEDFVQGERIYPLNLLVANKKKGPPPIFIENTPSYERLFGTIRYEQSEKGLQTSPALIQAGALHRANGGILILRADMIARDSKTWHALKQALRDREIRIEEFHREGTIPMATAPTPEPIPLDIKIILIGSPSLYQALYDMDPDFRSFFKIKADIDQDMEASAQNIGILQNLFKEHYHLEEKAFLYLLGYLSRWANHRERLSALYEAAFDLLEEAYLHSPSTKIKQEALEKALEDRRRRNSGLEDRLLKNFNEGLVHIDTQKTKIGQINGLTVLSTGDHSFGLPSRITARTFASAQGIINIECLTEMSGPIQQKGVLILEGYLRGRFTKGKELALGASLTFEQNYNLIEGDSASMAELCAILSSLADLPLKQAYAITGSVDQYGNAQAVGGINHKIEGFYHICKAEGLTGQQGVLIPKVNEKNIILHQDVCNAVEEGLFHLWSYETVEEALSILLDTPKALETLDKRVREKLDSWTTS